MRKLNELVKKDLLFNGVYMIVCNENQKTYIGSCAAKDFIYLRLLHHQKDLISNRYCNIHLQNSFNKYGIENFTFAILEECLPEKCLEREQYWMDLLNPDYNICKTAGNSLGRVFSEESKKKMSETQKKRWKEKPELRENMSKLHKGKKLTEEQIEHLRSKLIGRKHSEETKRKITGRKKKIIKNEENMVT